MARWILGPSDADYAVPLRRQRGGLDVTEVGRQPWIIYGIMRTAQGTSPTVNSGETLFTIVGFVGLYFLLGVLFLTLVLREIGNGPSTPRRRTRPDVQATVAFAVIAFMLTAYVLLDGYDLGVAAISPLIARSDAERAATMASIGPFWNGTRCG